MAEELGAGYISLLPSMRGFSKLVKAELKKALRGIKGDGVEVPVTPVLDQKLFDEAIKANKKPLKVPVQLEPLRDQPGGKLKPVRIPVEVDRDAFQRSLTGLGKDSRSTIHQRVEIDTDKDFVRGQVADAFKQGGSNAASLFGSSFSASLPVLILGAVVAVLGAPLIAAATGALLLSGAALGAVFFGAFLLKGDEDLKKAWDTLFGDVKKTLTEAAAPLKGPFLEALRIVGKAFRDISPDIKAFFATIAKSGGIQDLARGFAGLIKSFAETGAMQKLADAIGPILTQIGMALPDIGNSISQFLISITKPETIAFVGKLLRFVADLVRFIGSAIGFLISFVGTVGRIFSGIMQVGAFVLGIFSGAPATIAVLQTALSTAISWIKEKWRGLWDEAKTKVTTTVASVKTTVEGIPGKVKGALSNAKTLLLQAGKNIVQGLIDGIKDKLGALATIASQMAGTVRSFLPFSPAKQGPLSGSGNPYHSGQVIAGDVAKGVQSQLPAVTTAASQLAGSFGFRSSAAAAAAPANQPTVVAAGDRATQALIDVLKEGIRARNGGNVNLALGS